MDSYQSVSPRENMTEGESASNINIEDRDEEISSWRVSDTHEGMQILPEKVWMSEKDI